MIQQRKIAKYVLLQIITLGIYGLFFWSDWTEDLNKMCKDDDKDSANYILVFILDIFSLGIYSFIWNYTQAERMYRIAPKYGIELKHGGSYVLLLRTILFFLPVIGSVERIKSFNALAVAYNSTLSEDEIIAAQEEAKEQKKSKKEIKAEKKAEKKAAKKEAASDKKLEKANKKSKKDKSFEEDEQIIPTEVGVLPGHTDDSPVDITGGKATIEIPAPSAKEEPKEYLTEENAPVYFEAPKFETVEPETATVIEETIVEVPAIEIPTAEEIAETLTTEPVEEIDFKAPVFEVIDETPASEEIKFSEPTFEVVEEPIYEIADVEIPELDFSAPETTETSVEVEEVTEIAFSEPAAYEISTEIADVTFIDDEELVPAAKDDILKKATKTVGNKRTVKEKVADAPAAKKSTKTTEEKATKATKEKKETATKSTKTKKETATKSTAAKTTKPKATKAQKEKAEKELEKIVEEVKIDDVSFGDITFEEVDLEADILNEIAEISKSKK